MSITIPLLISDFATSSASFTDQLSIWDIFFVSILPLCMIDKNNFASSTDIFNSASKTSSTLLMLISYNYMIYLFYDLHLHRKWGKNIESDGRYIPQTISKWLLP